MTFTDELALPWNDLADAAGRLEDARRARELATDDLDRALADADVADAHAECERAADHLAAVGCLLLKFALERGGMHAQKILGAVFGDLNAQAYKMARASRKALADVLAELDTLKSRIRQLEKVVDDLTPGVGCPDAD